MIGQRKVRQLAAGVVQTMSAMNRSSKPEELQTTADEQEGEREISDEPFGGTGCGDENCETCV